MMFTSILFLFFVSLFTSVKMVDKLPTKSDNFGPYNVIHKRYETCKGPKVKNVADFSANITIHGNHKLKCFHFVFPKNTSIDEIKTVLYSVTGDKKKILYKYKLTDPCQHYFAAAMIKSYFKINSCVVPKGNYELVIDPEETVKSYLGPKFFYGDYMFKTNVLSKQGNIMCMFIEHEIVKKDD